ncbi:hypothetical protein GGF31_005418 [Allomyces arbusculus]|nr:hypothetical protein GGF31_005418 [Allomyces arbusculus]
MAQHPQARSRPSEEHSILGTLDKQIVDLVPNLPSVVAPIQAIAQHPTHSRDPLPPFKDFAIPLISELLAGVHHAATTLALTTSRADQLESDLVAATSRATVLAADLVATQSALHTAAHDRDTAHNQLATAIDAVRQAEFREQDLESRVLAERKARHAQAHAAKVRLAADVAKSRASEIARWLAVAETIEGLGGSATCGEVEVNPARPGETGSPTTSLRDAETRVQTALAHLAARIQDERRAHEMDVAAMSQRVAELERDLRETVERERETRSALGEQAKEFHEHQVEREAQVGVLFAESSAKIETLTSVARELHGKLARASKDQALLVRFLLKVMMKTGVVAPAAKSGTEDPTSLDPRIARLRAELKRKATLLHHLQTQLTTATDTTAALAADAERSVEHFRRQLHDAKSRVRSLEGVVREVVRWCVSQARPAPPPVDKVAAREDAPSPALAARADRIARTFLNVSYDDLQRQAACKALGELGRVDGVLRRLDEILVRGSRSGSMARETVALLQRSAGASASMTAEGTSGGLEAEGQHKRL